MRAVVLVLLSALLFGASTPASKVLLTDVHPVQLAGWLYVGAALGVLPAHRRGGALLPARRDGKNALRLGGAILFGGVLGPVALLLGLRLASAASASLWLNLEAAATAALGSLFFRDHLSVRGWSAVMGVVGAGAILSAGQGSGGAGAALFIALACVFWGLDNHLTALIDGISPAQTTFWKGIVAGSFNLTLAALLGAGWPGTGPVLAAVGVGTLAYGVSIALYISSAQELGATRAQLFFSSAPFLGAGLSWLTLGESIGASHLVGGGVLAGSLAVLFGDRHRHHHAHDALEHTHSHRHDDGHHEHLHPGLPASHRHSHRHRHAPVVHTHPHWPDLHHRHLHGGGDGP
jgi:drug/metabolite transporter (DMT)-like permease